jgi:hypothetical protein
MRERNSVVGIRTVMVTVPAMLGDLIKHLAVGRVELQILAELDTRRGLVRRLKALRPDLIVIGFETNGFEMAIRSLLTQQPGCRLIVLRPDGRIVGYELRLHRTRLSERTPDGLIDFIRGVVESRRRAATD